MFVRYLESGLLNWIPRVNHEFSKCVEEGLFQAHSCLSHAVLGIEIDSVSCDAVSLVSAGLVARWYSAFWATLGLSVQEPHSNSFIIKYQIAECIKGRRTQVSHIVQLCQLMVPLPLWILLWYVKWVGVHFDRKHCLGVNFKHSETWVYCFPRWYWSSPVVNAHSFVGIIERSHSAKVFVMHMSVYGKPHNMLEPNHKCSEPNGPLVSACISSGWHMWNDESNFPIFFHFPKRIL